MAHGPEQPGQRHVDHHQRGRQEGHFSSQQTETRVDVVREDAEEMVDDGNVVHGIASVAVEIDGLRGVRCAVTDEAPPHLAGTLLHGNDACLLQRGSPVLRDLQLLCLD